MANTIPCFFLVPTWDYPPPPDGPIRLGNVITSVKTPERALVTIPVPEGSGAFSSGQRQVSFSQEALRTHQYGVFTRFLSLMLGGGIDAGVKYDKSDSSVFEFETLKTTQFLPKSDYLEQCLAAEPVQRYLTKSRCRKPIYIVTGLKIVSGAKAKSLLSIAGAATLKAEVDLTAIGGGPMNIGPAVESRQETHKGTAWEGCNDFVFAYRVRKIVVARKDGSIKKDEDYKKGAMMDSAAKTTQALAFEVVTDDEGDPKYEGFFKEEVEDGCESVSCAIPMPEFDDDGDY